MRKYETTMADTIRTRCYQNGMTLGTLSKKAGIAPATMTRRMADGRWDRTQLQRMHRYLHFTQEDLQIFLEGR